MKFHQPERAKTPAQSKTDFRAFHKQSFWGVVEVDDKIRPALGLPSVWIRVVLPGDGVEGMTENSWRLWFNKTFGQILKINTNIMWPRNGGERGEVGTVIF